MYLFPVGSDVNFSLNSTAYHNNSIVTLEKIGEGDDALLCVTNQTDCCRFGSTKGNWYFPNGSRVASSNAEQDFYRDRGQSVVHLKRRRGGVDGIYRCEILDSLNDMQSIYIGVYSARTGE